MITYLCGLHILFIPIRWTLHHCITAQLACWILGVALSAEDRIRIVPDTVLCGLTGSSTMHSSVLVLTSPSGPRSLASVVISCESHILMYSHIFSYILIIYSHFRQVPSPAALSTRHNSLLQGAHGNYNEETWENIQVNRISESATLSHASNAFCR